jgi:heme exporter protein A
MPLLSAHSLSCERDDRCLFSELDFAVNTGDILQIEGPNGSGKTTLLRILAGLAGDYSGKLFWHDQPLHPEDSQYCRQMLYFGHQGAVKGALTAEENLQWMAQMHGDGQVSQVQLYAALEQVGLRGFEDVPVHTLSAGQKRRVALARLFLAWTPLWLLDEPFTALDKQGVAALEKVIVQHADQGGTVLLTTHHKLDIPDERLMILSLGGRR